jgi:hypothetical protein
MILRNGGAWGGRMRKGREQMDRQRDEKEIVGGKGRRRCKPDGGG